MFVTKDNWKQNKMETKTKKSLPYKRRNDEIHIYGKIEKVFDVLLWKKKKRLNENKKIMKKHQF